MTRAAPTAAGVRFAEITLDDFLTLHAEFDRCPPEPDAGFQNARYECRKLIVRLDWQGRPDAKFPASKWRKHERELTGDEFDAMLDCYEERLLAEVEEPEPAMDDDNGGRA